jgi:hypothetical protein
VSLVFTKIADLADNQLAGRLTPKPGTGCSMSDGDGGIWHGYQKGDGSLVPVWEVVAGATSQAAQTAAQAAVASAVTTENNRATTVQNALALLDAGTATMAQVQTILATIIRYVGSQRAKL